jgi:hypothetical protein
VLRTIPDKCVKGYVDKLIGDWRSMQNNAWDSRVINVCSIKQKAMANPSKSKSNSHKDPCWKGYEQVGMKEKDGKQVPNCVPENKSSSSSSSSNKKK